MKAGKPKIFRARLEIQKRVDLQLSQGSLEEEFLFRIHLIGGGPSTSCRVFCFTADWNDNPIWNNTKQSYTTTLGLVLDQISGYHDATNGHIKLTVVVDFL